MKTQRNLAVIVAAGRGRRFESELPKQFAMVGGRPILAIAIEQFEKSPLIDEIVLVVPEDYLGHAWREIVDKHGFKKVQRITAGGDTRQESVLAGLSACPRVADAVAIHDGVRPFVRQSLIEALFEAVVATGAVIPVVKPKDTVKIIEEDNRCKTLPREKVYLAQTPQVFTFSKILDIHLQAVEMKLEATDDAMLAEQFGMKVVTVPGYYDNIKITTADDLILAEEIAKRW